MRIFSRPPSPPAPKPWWPSFKSPIAHPVTTEAHANHFRERRWVSFPKLERPPFWRRQTPIMLQDGARYIHRRPLNHSASTNMLRQAVEEGRDKAEAAAFRAQWRVLWWCWRRR